MEKSAKERLEEAEKIIDENYDLEAEEEKIEAIQETSLGELSEEDETPGVKVIKFDPITYTNKNKKEFTVSEVVIEARKITGRVIANSEKQFMSNGFSLDNGTIFNSAYFQLIVASKITGIDLEFFLDELPSGVVVDVGIAVMGFLPLWGSKP